MPITVIYLCVAMLFIGALPIPWYDYYTLLRIVACSVFALATIISFSRKRRPLALAFAILAVLFNPFIKVHFQTDIWNLVDVVAGVLLLITAKKLKMKA